MKVFKGIGREFIFFSGSTVTFQASRLLVAMIVARWVGPIQFGIWNALQPLLDYGKLFLCGIPNAMNREVPVLMGRGKKKEAEEVINFTFWFLLIFSSILGLILALLSLFLNFAEDYKMPLLCSGLLFMVSNIYLFCEFLLKSRIQFFKMSFQQLIYAASYPFITLIFSYYMGVSGFILGQSLSAALISYVIFRIFSVPIRGSIPWRLFYKLAKIGIPLMAAGLLYNLLITVDRWIILGHLGIKELGDFTLPILVFGSINRVPRIISEQMYPRMAFRYGETGSRKALVSLILQHSFSALVLTVPLIIIAYLILPTFVSLVMPQYSSGILAARIMLLSLLFLPLISGIGNFLIVIDKQVYYLLVQAVAVIINVGLGIWFVKLGWGIKGVAWADVATYFCYSFLVSVVGIVVLIQDKSIKKKTT